MSQLDTHIQNQKTAADTELSSAQALIDRLGQSTDIQPTLVPVQYRVKYIQAAGSALSESEFEALLVSLGLNEA